MKKMISKLGLLPVKKITLKIIFCCFLDIRNRKWFSFIIHPAIIRFLLIDRFLLMIKGLCTSTQLLYRDVRLTSVLLKHYWKDYKECIDTELLLDTFRAPSFSPCVS